MNIEFSSRGPPLGDESAGVRARGPPRGTPPPGPPGSQSRQPRRAPPGSPPCSLWELVFFSAYPARLVRPIDEVAFGHRCMNRQDDLLASAQAVAGEAGDQTLVQDVSTLLKLASSLPGEPYDARDPLKGIRKEWRTVAQILQQDVAALKRLYRERRAGVQQVRTAPADRLTVEVNQPAPDVDPDALQKARDYHAAIEAGAPADLQQTLAHGQVLLQDSKRRMRDGALSAERSTLALADLLLDHLKRLHDRPLRQLQWALWRVRLVRWANASVRALIGATFYFVLILIGMGVEGELQQLVGWISQNKLHATLLLALVVLIIEWLKSLTIERYFEDWLRRREHAATAAEISGIATLAATARILIARMNAA